MNVSVAPNNEAISRFFEMSQDMLCIADSNGYFKVINPAWSATLGFTDEELLAAPFVSFVHPDDVDGTIAETQKLGQGVRTIYFENRYQCKDGAYKWLAWTASPSDEGLIYAIARDVSQQKQSEQARNALAAIVEGSDDAIFSKDLNGIISSWNAGAERTYGYTAAEIVGKHASVLFPEDRKDELERILTRVKQGERLDHYETVRVHKDGRHLDISLTVSPMRDVTGKIIGVSKIARDITERKQAERQIQMQNEALVKANRELAVSRKHAEEATRIKSEFLATMSHELRTPLNAIIGYTEIQLAGMTGDLTEEQADYEQRTLVNAENLLNLINEVLDLSKIEAGRIEMAKAPFSIRDLLGEVMYQTKGLVADKGIVIESVLAPDMPAALLGDYLRLKQIAINLLSNAIKFTDQGKVRIEISKQSAENWSMVVSDTGIGIPSHALEYIFDEFRQVDGSSLRKHGGTGLGLAIVRKLVTMMGGTVRVKSRVGEGTTFTVVLPIVTDTDPSIEASIETNTEAAAN